jgi:TonB family protein
MGSVICYNRKRKVQGGETNKMIKAKEITLIDVLGVAAFATILSVGFFVTKHHSLSSKSAPIFMGEEITVNKEVAGVRGITRLVEVVKPVSLPAPAPQVAAPSPIMPPRISSSFLPSYPLSAVENELGGVTLLSVYVGLAGNPERVEVKQSSGNSELDQAAQKAVSRWLFQPATQGNVTLASWLEIPVRFEVK